MTSPRARWALAVLLALGASAAPPGGQARADAASANGCRTTDVPVGVEPVGALRPDVQPLPSPRPVTLAVRTCVQAGGKVPRGVQVLVHGAVTDHRYWNLPGRHSWGAAALAAGWATAAVDRFGSGGSSHPPSALVTSDANAAAVGAVARSLRAGQVSPLRGRFRPARVVLVGHSMGSGVAALAASRSGDADALILTGYSHYSHYAPEPYAPAVFAAALQPAALDPRFARLDPGYLTTRPGTGRALAAGERRWFPAAPSVSGVIVPGAGHMLNAFRSAPGAFAAALGWLTSIGMRIGRGEIDADGVGPQDDDGGVLVR